MENKSFSDLLQQKDRPKEINKSFVLDDESVGGGMTVWSRLNTAEVGELDGLMKQNPSWTSEYPQVYRTLRPVRHVKDAAPACVSRRMLAEVQPHRLRTGVPVSDYKATYLGQYVRPRSVTRPPPSASDLHLRLGDLEYRDPTTFTSTQKMHYLPQDVTGRTQPVLPKETYESPSESFNAVSSYTEQFPAKPLTLPKVQGHTGRPQGRKVDPGRFDDRTTYKEWHPGAQPEPRWAFGELPSFTDSVVFPEKQRHAFPEPTTRETFRGERGAREPPFGTSCTLSLQGEMDHTTMNSLAYARPQGAERAVRVEPRSQMISTNREPFQGDTQSRRDYGGRREFQPPPRPITPAPSTIDLKFHDRASYVTEQKQQFQGVDPAVHPKPQSCRRAPEAYSRPDVAMETTTSHKVHYPPLPAGKVAVSAPCPPREATRRVSPPRFSGSTTSGEHFRPWRVEPRVLYGDPHEAEFYIPPLTKFARETTTGQTYLGRFAARPGDFKPAQNRTDPEPDARDFSTMYATAYNPRDLSPARRLASEDAKFLLHQLRKKQQQQQQQHQQRQQLEQQQLLEVPTV